MRPTVGGRYLHWDALRRRDPPTGLTRAEWWTGVKLSRVGLSRRLPLRDVRGRPFSFMLPDGVQEALHRIDSRAHGRIGIGDEAVNRETRDRFMMDSLIREAITSSQLEGAATTRAPRRSRCDAGFHHGLCSRPSVSAANRGTTSDAHTPGERVLPRAPRPRRTRRRR